MKTIFFECNMGAAGDMLMAALLELHDDPKGFLNRLNAIGIPEVIVAAEPSVKCGITGTGVRVKIGGREEHCHDSHDHSHNGDDDHHHDHDHDHHHDNDDNHHHHGDSHHHNSYHDIKHLIDRLTLSPNVKKNALAVYTLIAEAESRVHGVSVDKIHFHEVGELDAVADIVGVCMLMEELAPDTVLSTPVNTGSGHVRCAHGVLPVPAPATARILQNIPIYSDKTSGELCTPTGAALLRHFVKEFREMPVMAVSKIGYGMGKKDFDRANCVRAYIGNIVDDNINAPAVAELSCNLDDMTPESIAFAQELLLHEGALDVWTESIGMKKSRPGIKFVCLCTDAAKEKMLSLIFKHTTTLGIRENICRRYTLQREHTEVETNYGIVRIKTASGYGVKKSKPEYEDIAKIARENGISIQEAASWVYRLHD
ncbi:MAG: nickel pincer cofactor biosynthesis protein LarC [Chitinispirillales bacterium]|jgi:uncharacterized protein (TIGR00299 family) protein|nr:nickel pincer cofactor biosynthesis protein LarC [Chitinispirillales bacterium]